MLPSLYNNAIIFIIFNSGLTNSNPTGEIPMPEGYKLETVTPGHAEGVIIK